MLETSPSLAPGEALLGEVKTLSVMADHLRRENVAASLKRNTPRLADHLRSANPKTPIAIVGGGPSLDLEEIRNFQGDTIACGSVHSYLLRNGIHPTYAVNIDPDACMALWYKPASKKTIYIMASHCHRATFNALVGKKIWLWHAAGEAPQEDFNGEISFAGGSTAALRAWPIAYQLGYRDFHFFGVDSCFRDATDAGKHADPKYWEPTPGEVFTVRVDGDPERREYLTSPVFAHQAREFATLLQYFQVQGTVKVHGDSLVAAYHRQISIWKPLQKQAV